MTTGRSRWLALAMIGGGLLPSPPRPLHAQADTAPFPDQPIVMDAIEVTRSVVEVLRIENLAEMIRPGEEEDLECASGRVRLVPAVASVCRGQDLRAGTTIEVDDNVYVRVRFEGLDQRGRFTLATDIVDDVGDIVGIAGSSSALYDLGEDPDRAERFDLRIARGVAVIDLARGGFLSFTTPVDQRSTMVGTRVAVVVPEDGTPAWIFVERGVVRLPDGSELREGQLARVSNAGVVTRPPTPDAGLARRLDDAVDYNLRAMWGGGGWWAVARWPVLIGGGGTAVYFVGRAIGWWGGDSPVSVGVKIPAPFP